MNSNLPIGLQLAIIDRAFLRSLDEKAQALGLTGVQLRVLGELDLRERSGGGEVNQKDLEQSLYVTHPTMTEIIKRLEKKGFVQCTTSAVDRRYKKITSTQKATEVHKVMIAQDAKIMETLCQGLSKEDVEHLNATLTTILGNISPKG